MDRVDVPVALLARHAMRLCQVAIVGSLLALGGCQSSGSRAQQSAGLPIGEGAATGAPGTVSRAPANAGVGVNSYLWRASLDTLSFMPLASADPFGGTIITDWYAPPQTPDERFKATVYILDKSLRADALRVSVFRQTKAKDGSWQDASVDPATSGKVENAILTRARQLRIAAGSK